MLLARAAEAARRLVALAAWLGGRTLAVYVLHMPLVALLDRIGDTTSLAAVVAGTPVLTLLCPAFATAAVLVGCLLLHALLRRAGLGLLFTAPGSGRSLPRTVDLRGTRVMT